ncbi:DUF721 domain-containing protein [Natranaerobius thermophilus]|uniref:DUF721 domain-containing protein n=1 Tax=Natranaerobius thermophilus (strain ATCC BAA-1301 / DSM 18059 / JW/NM-WN-LF) TaxID=457570 RepID=B2A2Z0_NATTJ|nr:DUF721 domain-containing protein [Natranaerobius thermophilus]ACB83604.1 hypothetical protein Nther_0005 [Natranaerobius thermophilus JW/NM-WN-LF]
MQGIRNDLKKFLAKSGLLKKFYQEKAMNYWVDVVGEEIATNCQPKVFQGKKMIVVCSNSIWIQELSMRKKNLIKKLNEKVGKTVVTDIKFVTGQIPNNSGLNLTRGRSKYKEIPLETKEKDWVEKTTSEIEDENLQKKLAKLMEQDLKYKKGKKSQGYSECDKCGKLTNNKGICQDCIEENERKKLNTLIRILKDSPWLNYNELQEEIPSDMEITRRDYNRAKNQFYQRVKDELFKAKQVFKYNQTQKNYDWLKDLLQQYVLIITEEKPEEIDDKTWETAVGALGKEYLELANKKLGKDG